MKQADDMEEKVFLQIGADSVTTSKIVINGNTYATRNVGSVRMETKPGHKMAGILTLVIGLFMAAGTVPLFGLTLIVAGAIIIFVSRERARLLLMAGGGESLAVESPNMDYVKKLHAAIVEAISSR